MRAAAGRLAHLVKGRPDSELRARPSSSAWSAHEVVGHLADHEPVLGFRLRMAAAHDRPSISGYDQEAFITRLGLERRTTAELLTTFRSGRELTLELLGRLPEDAWSRVGLHDERGEESIERMVRIYAGHDLIHEAQIARLLGG
jgi:uncharacterized damage-inducible protein DinB